jgi:DNA-binding transcriptional MerR regulator
MKIGELPKAAATKAKTVRFYEKSGTLPDPARTSGNYHNYALLHLQRLSFIRCVRNLGFALDDVRDFLALTDNRDQPCGGVVTFASAHLAAVEHKIADLIRMANQLRRIIGSCRQATVGDYKIIETLAPCSHG